MPVNQTASVANAAAVATPTIGIDDQQVWLEFKETWSGSWIVAPELIPISLLMQTGSAGMSELQFEYLYGPQVKEPFDSALTAIKKIDLRGYWVRVQANVDGNKTEQVWIGRIKKPVEAVGGDKVKNTAGTTAYAQGVQRWVAYGPEAILEEKQVSSSYWPYSGATAKEMGWMPGVNLRGGQTTIGNRSADVVTRCTAADGTTRTISQAFIFGGTDRWSIFTFFNYLAALFIEETDGPKWYIAGNGGNIMQWLTEFEPSFEWNGVKDCRSIVQMMIADDRGLDYKVVPTPSGDGFEVTVFSLLAEDDVVTLPVPRTASGPQVAKIPANTDRRVMNVCEDKGQSVNIEWCQTNTVDAIRIVGDRIKSVFSLGEGAVGSYAGTGKLVKGWSAALETLYLAGTGTPADSADKHDQARSGDQYRAVFRHFMTDVATFDWQGGKANPRIKREDGSIVYDAAYQLYEWFPLERLLLEAQVDYSVYPPVVKRATGVPAEFLPFIGIVKDTIGGRYSLVDALSQLVPSLPNGNVQPLANYLGAQVHFSPAHVLARTRWTGAAPTRRNPEAIGLNYDYLTVTIAAQTDQRLELEFKLPADLRAGNGAVKIVPVAHAQFWWLAPQTVIDVSATGTLVKSPSTSSYNGVTVQGVILRDDRNVLAQYAAGSVGRFLKERIRLSIHSKRMEAWHSMLGSILDVTGQNAELTNTRTPVTSVRFNYVDRTTDLFAGQSQRAA